jgi:hypothetical protein
MPEYHYFPSRIDGLIQTVLLDANVVGHLDAIARRGSAFRNDVVRRRMAGLVRRLDADALVMGGLGAVESVMRRAAGPGDVANYHRRATNAMRLLGESRSVLQVWIDGRDVPLDVLATESEENSRQVFEENFDVLRDNFILPSYAMVLKAYQLFLIGGDPIRSLRELELFAEELHGRGSRELMLGAALLAGNATGREMALNIMKLTRGKDGTATLDALWNTSFDLTYSRVATVPSLPGFSELLKQPAVFVTDDRHLGRLLTLVEHRGAVPMERGGALTADLVQMGRVLRSDLAADVARIVHMSSAKARLDPADVHEVGRVRRYKARKYVEHLEGWFSRRHEPGGTAGH